MAGHRQFASAGESQLQLNQNRLRQYDAAVSTDERNRLNNDKFDFQKQKEAFSEAYKDSERDRKVSDFQQRLDISDRRAQLAEEAAKVREQVAQNTELLKQHAQLVKDKATLARQNAGMEFYKGIANLDPQSPDFRSKYSDLMSNVQSKLVDSDGKLPEDVMKVSDHLFAQHNTWAAVNAKPRIDPVHQFQDALAASKPQYGVADANGKNFNATEAGKGDQSHVQTTYIPPGSTKAVTQVFPRTVFDAAVTASQSRQQGAAPAAPASAVVPAPPVTAAPVAAAAAPVIPQAHIDYLQQNPDTAAQFESKYGAGAAQQYIQRPE